MPHVTAEHLAAVRLTLTEGIGPRRLRMILERCSPTSAIEDILGSSRSSSPSPSGPWNEWAPRLEAIVRSYSDDRLRDRLGDSGVVLLGEAAYPPMLATDHEAPAVLFHRGDLGVLLARRIAVVGTRHCTERGRSLAADIGRRAAVEGIVVVSGLALGIDAAAHRGVMAAIQIGPGAPPVAVVASGLDVVYPKANGGLWKVIGESGVIISESPPGTPPDRFRFPLRNRLIAAMSELVLVVESRIRGGSMITVDEALKRDLPVMAVPGPVDLAASAGTNQLLRDGALVMAEIDDVFTALGLCARHRFVTDRRVDPDDRDRMVLEAFDGAGPLTLDMIASRLDRIGVSLTSCALSLGRLEAQGWIVAEGGWFERLPSPPGG